MENKRQIMDNFFRKNISDFELSEKKSNWELLNHLLNEQERKRKRRRWFLFFLFFIVMLSASLSVLLPGKKLNQNTDHKTGPSNTPVATENNSVKNEGNKPAATILSNKNETVKEAGNDSQQTKSENNASVPEEKNNPHNPVMNNEVRQAGVVHTTTNEQSEVKPGNNFNISQSNIPANDSAKTVIRVTENSKSLVATYRDGNDSLTPNTITLETANPNSISPDSLIIKPTGSDSLPTIAKNNSIADSAMTKQLIPTKTRSLSLSFYAGLNIYNTSRAFTNHQNISPLIGLELVHPLTAKFSVGLAGLYSLQGGYSLNDTVRQEYYFLDKNVSQQSIQIRQLHKLYFPLTLYYAIAKKHSALCAIQLSYLVNTNGNYSEINTTSGVTTESQKNNVKGYMDGIKSTNISFSLGYKFSLSRRFDLSTRITRDLKDSFTKEFFYGVSTKPSWSLQAFLQVKF